MILEDMGFLPLCEGVGKVSVPGLEALAWDVCSMTHLETHFPMH